MITPVRVILLTLPVELICYILAELDVFDLLPCNLVCKCLRKAILKSSRLQYRIELVRHRMVSVLPFSTGKPLAARLNILRDREQAWKRLRWRSKHTLHFPVSGSVYEFVGGIYANGREDGGRVAASISFFQLPSADTRPDNELKTWTHNMESLSVIDFTMDPMQDLLVLVCLAQSESGFVYEIHLRTLSTNEPHPKAPTSKLCSLSKGISGEFDSAETGASLRVQVAGHLLALLVKEVLDGFEAWDGVGAHLQIWNWHVSTPNTCTMVRMAGIDDFCFLSRDTVLVVAPVGRLEVWTFPDPAVSMSPLVQRAMFELPPLSQGFMYWYISMSCNPSEGYLPGRADVVTGTQEGSSAVAMPFYNPRPDERIHACCVYVVNSDHVDDVQAFVFFVNIKTFLEPWPTRLPPVVPWDEWGPQNTRWFPELQNTDWQHALYGYRTADCVSATKGMRVRVRNFNPYAVKQCTGEFTWRDEWRCKVVKGPSIVVTRGAFQHEIESRLPYTEVVSEDTFDVTNVMIDECRILLLKGIDGNLAVLTI